MNLYGCETIVGISLAAGYIGVGNFSWLLYYGSRYLFCRKVVKAKKLMITGNYGIQLQTDSTNNTEPDTPMSPTELNRGADFDFSLLDTTDKLTAFDIFKYIWSTVVSVGAVVVILYGIYRGESVLPASNYVTYIILLLALTMLFFLEGVTIAIVGTQYWDKETFITAYPNAYILHELVNRPDNVKRFIMGRQFGTILVSFLMAQVSTFPDWSSDGYNPVLFYLFVKSGLPGVLFTLAFGQLMPELLAAEYPLRFMNMRLSSVIVKISLFFDTLGVGHCAWAIYYAVHHFVLDKTDEDSKINDTKPAIVRVKSAELMHKTGSPYGTFVTVTFDEP